MTLVKTLLGAFLLCAASLAWIDYAVGPVPPGAGGPGLTAATVLASDGMGPDGRPGDGVRKPALDREALRRLADTASRTSGAADGPEG